MSESESSNFKTQQSLAIPAAESVAAADETSAHPGDSGTGGSKKRTYQHKKYLTRNASRRMLLLDSTRFPKFASKYSTGEKAGQRIKWFHVTRVKRLRKYGIGRGSVGTIVVRTRVMKGLKSIRDTNMPVLAPFFKPDARVTFQAGAIDAALRASDLFLHERAADARQVATNKFGETRRVTEYDARRAWAIASGDGGRHLADIPFTAREGEHPVHVKRKGRGGGVKKCICFVGYYSCHWTFVDWLSLVAGFAYGVLCSSSLFKVWKSQKVCAFVDNVGIPQWTCTLSQSLPIRFKNENWNVVLLGVSLSKGISASCTTRHNCCNVASVKQCDCLFQLFTEPVIIAETSPT
jgi:hypothetical protein